MFLFNFILFSGLPCGSAGKESACNVGDLGLVLGLGLFPGEGKGYPLQYSGLENSMDCIAHGVAKSQTRLNDIHFISHTVFWASLVAQMIKDLPATWETWVQPLGWENPLEKEMANNSSIVAWRNPWTEDPSGLQSVWSQRVGHD